MKIKRLNDLDLWECKCGTITPLKHPSKKPICEYCRRVSEFNKNKGD